MTKSSRTDWSRLARQDDKDIDTSDIPELDQDFSARPSCAFPPSRR